MTSRLRLVGFYKELGIREEVADSRSIQDVVSGEPLGDEGQVVGYLSSGVPVLDIMEGVNDVISRDFYVAAGSSILTDGVWVWRVDLPYYVGRYHLRLDEGFLSHVRDASYVVPQVSKMNLISIAREVASDVLGMR
jgi:hypothetical protein